MAKGSTGEVLTHLYVALDQAYITEETFERLRGLVNETARLIGGLMNYLRRTEIKGGKYK